MESRIGSSHFNHMDSALEANLFRKSLATDIFTGSSIYFHDSALITLDNEKRLNEGQNIIQHWSRSLPVINWTSKFFLTCPSISGIFRTSKGLFKPYNQFLIAISYFKECMPLEAVAVFALFYSAYIKAALSIYNSSQISYLLNGMTCFEFDDFTHGSPFVYNSIALNEIKVHAERLSEKAQQWDAIV